MTIFIGFITKTSAKSCINPRMMTSTVLVDVFSISLLDFEEIDNKKSILRSLEDSFFKNFGSLLKRLLLISSQNIMSNL